MPVSPSRKPTPAPTPAPSSQDDLLQKLKFDISQKFPEFTFLVEIERFPFMSRAELMQEIQETQAKANEASLKLAGQKRKRTVRTYFIISFLIFITNPQYRTPSSATCSSASCSRARRSRRSTASRLTLRRTIRRRRGGSESFQNLNRHVFLMVFSVLAIIYNRAQAFHKRRTDNNYCSKN